MFGALAGDQVEQLQGGGRQLPVDTPARPVGQAEGVEDPGLRGQPGDEVGDPPERDGTAGPDEGAEVQVVMAGEVDL